MGSNMWIIISSVGVVIIAVLSVVAWRLQNQVKQAEDKKLAQRQEYDRQVQDKRDSINKSIQILAKSLREDQLSKTEAAIRISALLEFLGVEDTTKEKYSAFFQLAEATAHIPILEKWKALSTKEKLHYDSEREVLEEKYGDFVVDAAMRIIGNNF
jgi:type II secretory pathway component PulJ